jgi:hypothetical protein
MPGSLDNIHLCLSGNSLVSSGIIEYLLNSKHLGISLVLESIVGSPGGWVHR